MRARKRNPYWGQGLDARQARRLRRRMAEEQRWSNVSVGLNPDGTLHDHDRRAQEADDRAWRDAHGW